MDKRRKILEAVARNGTKGTSKVLNERVILQALTALNKLEKEKMLECVGEDAKYPSKHIQPTCPCNVCLRIDDYNQAKAEIRKKVRGL